MSLLRNLRHAVRTLLRSPGYALTCITILALGIGANTAIFSVVHSVILTPLPYPDAPRLVFVWERFPNMPDPPGGRIQVARKNYLEWKRQNTVFSDMAAFHDMPLDETGIDQPQRVFTGFASANLFPMLGVRPRFGRLFNADEERKDNDQVAILTDKYFDHRFHRDPAALGKSIILGGAAYTVIGVLPPKFHLPATWEGMDQRKPDVWVPLSRLWNSPNDDSNRQLLVMAQLRPGVSLAQSRTEMATIAQRLGQFDKKLDEGWTAAVFPFEVEDTSPTLHLALYVLLAAVAFLLLIACANLANLTLARETLRSREIAVRLALGATRTRILAQLVSESFVVSLLGAGAGLLLARWCIKLMLALEPPDIQRPELIGIDLPVFAFAAFASVLTTLLFGLAPSIAVSRQELSSALKAGGRGVSAARVRSRQFLIVVEVALALMLLSGAGLMARSFREMIATGIGFQTAHLHTVDIALPEKRYADDAARSRFFRTVVDRARTVPGVTAAAVIDNLPLHQIADSNFYIAGRPEPPLQSLPIADTAHSSPEYFGVIGLRRFAGRFFTDADLAFTEKDKDAVVIINQAFARQFFPGEEPLGKRLLSPDKKHASEIVGVVADYRPMGVENGVRPQMFWPDLRLRSATLIVRTRAESASLAHSIQSAIWSIDKDVPADKVFTMDYHLEWWQSQRKFNTLLMGIFAGLALLLAMMGIYGVLSNLIASRVREIGIRMAIGATSGQIVKLVLLQSMLPVAIGLTLGLTGTFALSPFLEALLYHVQARDPVTLVLAACTILLISPVAIYVPLRRATSVDCTVALREE
ncbi:MAG TPA: ABC transporter permease [Bryobacteraceae bacterium]|nr:ABC transporter permease [Bryobacteraceae bacterium]